MTEFDSARRLWLQRSAQIGLLMCAGTSTCAALAWDESPSDQSTSVQVQDGDVIFRDCTPDETTKLIKQVSPVKPGRWTHVGVIRWRQGLDPTPAVIHASPERKSVIAEPMSEFIGPEQAQGFALLRPSHHPRSAQLSEQAQSFMGMPFDYEMRTSDLQTLYCTELVARAWVGSIGGRNVRNFATIRVATYPEPILHADALFAGLLGQGDFVLMGASSWT